MGSNDSEESLASEEMFGSLSQSGEETAVDVDCELFFLDAIDQNEVQRSKITESINVVIDLDEVIVLKPTVTLKREKLVTKKPKKRRKRNKRTRRLKPVRRPKAKSVRVIKRRTTVRNRKRRKTAAGKLRTLRKRRRVSV